MQKQKQKVKEARRIGINFTINLLMFKCPQPRPHFGPHYWVKK